MTTESEKILHSMRYDNGLFAASKKNVSTGYHMAWLRDNIYAILGFEAVEKHDEVKKTLRALLDILQRHEYKIDWMIKEPHPKHAHRYIHARYHPETGDEIPGHWGNKQNDAVGAILFKICQLENKGVGIVRNSSDVRLLQKLVYYLGAIEYWQDPDNGVWENEEELHASSVGACLAGLKEAQKMLDVPLEYIQKGEEALAALLPRESVSRETDLALLSLIYPYNVVSAEMRDIILNDVETKLVRNKGVIRYFTDWYYAKDGQEAEWCFGLVWLAIIYKELNMPHKYAFYMRKSVEALTPAGELPELYVGGETPNENTPLAWAQSLWMVANRM